MYWRSFRSSRRSPTVSYRHNNHHHTTSAPYSKFILFASNCIFWLLSICLLITGLYAWIKKGTLHNLGRLASERTLFFDPAWFLIILSTATAVVTLLGCVGVLRENSRFLTAYIWLLSIAFIAEIAAVSLGYLFKNEAKRHASHRMLESLKKYHDDEDLQDLIDLVQADWLKCCGVNSYRDWEVNVYFNCSSATLGNVMACGVPYSCCLKTETHPGSPINRQCGFGKLKETQPHHIVSNDIGIYTEGCMGRLSQWLDERAVLLACIGLAIALIQLIGICFAYSLKTKINEQRRRHRRFVG